MASSLRLLVHATTHVAQIEALVRAGLARLGIAEIRRIHHEARLINLSYCDKTRDDPSADVSEETQAHHKIWSTWRQEQLAVDLAYRLNCALQSGNATR